MNNPPTTREPGSQQRIVDKQQKRLGREHSQSDPLVGRQAQRPSHQSSLSDSTVSTVGRLDPLPSAKQNKRMIKLSFSNQKVWEGEALFDTGSEENWMSKALSKQLQLPLNPHLEASYVGIQGEDMTSSMSVQGTWHWDHQTHSVTFRIAANPPISVIFGYPFLKKMKLVDFEKSTKKHAKLVVPVFRNTKKETKGNTAVRGRDGDEYKLLTKYMQRKQRRAMLTWPLSANVSSAFHVLNN